MLTKGVVFNEVEDAKGNRFRNRFTRLGGVSVLTVMTTHDKAYRSYRDPHTRIMLKMNSRKIGSRSASSYFHDTR